MMLDCGCTTFCGRTLTRCQKHTKPPLGPTPTWCANCDTRLHCVRCIAEHEIRKAEAMKQETIAVPVELVRELKRVALERRERLNKRAHGDVVNNDSANAFTLLADKLPEPPKPDVVEECALAYARKYNPADHAAIRAALRRYRELGCPEFEGCGNVGDGTPVGLL